MHLVLAPLVLEIERRVAATSFSSSTLSVTCAQFSHNGCCARQNALAAAQVSCRVHRYCNVHLQHAAGVVSGHLSSRSAFGVDEGGDMPPPLLLVVDAVETRAAIVSAGCAFGSPSAASCCAPAVTCATQHGRFIQHICDHMRWLNM